MADDALFKITNGLYVLGSRDGGRFVGSTVDAVMQVANTPDIVALSCNNNSFTKECIKKEGEFSLSVLGKKVNPFVIGNFGFQSSRSVNKWDNVEYFVEGNLPYLKDNIAIIAGKVVQIIKFSSHTLFLAEVVGCKCDKDDEALTYNEYRAGFKEEVFKAMKMNQNKGEQK